MDGKLVAIDEQTHLTLGPNSVITGEIKCWDLEILGQFAGKIEARGKVTLQSSAIVEGEINCHQLVVYPGAVTNLNANTLL